MHAANQGQKSSVWIKWFSLGEKQSERPQECGKWRRAKNQGLEREREKDGQKRTQSWERRKYPKELRKVTSKNDFSWESLYYASAFLDSRQSAHLHSIKLHRSSKFLLLHFVLFPPAHVVYQRIPFFWHLKGEKKSLVEKSLPKNENENVGEGARVALESTSHTQSGRSKHFRVSDGKPNISYYSFFP